MIQQLDEPLADFAALNIYFIAKAARDMGIKVTLSGAGGDDIFSGYRRHMSLNFEKYWDWLPLKLRFLIFKYSQSFSDNISMLRRVKKMFSGA